MTRIYPIWQAHGSDRIVPLMLVIVAHLMLIAWLNNHAMQPGLSLVLPTMSGILVAPPVAQPPRPNTVSSRPLLSPMSPIEALPTEHSISVPPVEPEPSLATESKTETPVTATAPAAAEAEIAPVPVIPPRVDAAHLNNPAPVYPPLSRRLGEQGQVLFDVYILADGTVGGIRLKVSSGFPRLDAAAREAVQRWRYVPARRGNTAIAYWYVQPIVFALGH
ncbi:MAG: energy transducer TonB [Gammaproteobacteria bacterium]|nr:energy transducer TonB [Gammaproteobacteria bacterium]